jgi:hypothetical protein
MSEPRIWIAQALCSPARHCILAAAGMADGKADADSAIAAPLQATISQLLKDGEINPWCGICGSPFEQWFVEVGRTRFRSAEEAKPSLAELQERNRAGRDALGGHPGPGKIN